MMENGIIPFVEELCFFSQIKFFKAENLLHHCSSILCSELDELLKLPLGNDNRPLKVGIAEPDNFLCIGMV